MTLQSVAAIGVCILLGACAANPTAPRATTADDMVASARAEITEISVAEASAQVDGAVVVDVREPAEYESGHVPGAVNVPRGTLEWRIENVPALKDLAPDARREQPILLYCRSGARAALATQTLQRLGYSDVRSIAGGYRAWTEEGLPTSEDAQEQK